MQAETTVSQNPLRFTEQEICTWSAHTQAISKLANAHFATFNDMEAARTKRQRTRLLKALGKIWRAALYLRQGGIQ